MKNCPLCGQTLPIGIDQRTLEKKLERLTAPALASQDKSIRTELSEQFREQVAELKRTISQKVEVQAETKARALAKREIELVRKQLEKERQRSKMEIQKARQQAIKEAKRFADERNRVQIGKLQNDRERDLLRFNNEKTQLQRKLEDLTRQMDNQKNEQRGSEAEVELFTALKSAFPNDRIQRVEKGKKGADIIHQVMDGAKTAGCIVYESKDTVSWQNKFIAKAKQYQVQYSTPHVMVVTRAFPKNGRGKGLWVEKDIPVVEPRVAVALAEIIRDGIIEISRLQLTTSGRNVKAQILFDYILSNEFTTRFQEIHEAVENLRERQEKEKDWHERHWEESYDIYERIQSRRREIWVKIKNIKENNKATTRQNFRVTA